MDTNSIPVAQRKELALGLISQMQEIATKLDDEMTRLKKIENPQYKKIGKDAIFFHLGVLKELIETL